MSEDKYYLNPGTLVRVKDGYGIIIGGAENCLSKDVRLKAGNFRIFFGKKRMQREKW